MKTNRLFWWQHRIIMEYLVNAGIPVNQAFSLALKEMKGN